MISPTFDRITPGQRPDRSPVLFQQWRHLTFLHWEVRPHVLQRLLPQGLTVDTFGGKAYVGLVPFTMQNVRPRWLPAVPALSDFHELNVRTYVLDRHGRPGVWFFSLDAANRIAVALARLSFRLPYFFAKMELDNTVAGQCAYRSARLSPGRPAGCDLTARFWGPPGPAAPGTLEHFLIERYFLFATAGEGLFIGQVHHRPYPIQAAAAQIRWENLLAAAGIETLGGRPLVHYAEGVDVEVFGLQAITAPCAEKICL